VLLRQAELNFSAAAASFAGIEQYGFGVTSNLVWLPVSPLATNV
jgi:hypothetical protein